VTETGLVLRARSGFYTVATHGGELVECRLRGRVTRERQASDVAVIGDRVELARIPEGGGVIESVAERRSRFGRRQPGPRGTWREDVLVANPDLVVVVFACDQPPPNPRLIDRFLVIAEHNEVAPLLVANKVDLEDARHGESRGRAILGDYERIGYQVLATSARERVGIAELERRLADRISVMVGPSGVGKSSLLNAIRPGLRLTTADVSAAHGKGRHTTTLAELLPLRDGTEPNAASGYVADTPGIRELGLWQIPADELAWCFVEMRPFLGNCGFSDCSHAHEPRCAVRAAVADGAVSAARYDSYLRMLTGTSRS
jgi:ribosome biogenesis GTPase